MGDGVRQSHGAVNSSAMAGAGAAFNGEFLKLELPTFR